MSAEKRPVQASFGSTQLVKRPRSDADLRNQNSLAISNSTTQHGALMKAAIPGKFSRRGLIQRANKLLPVEWIGRYVRRPAIDVQGHFGVGQKLICLLLLVLWRTYGQCENYGVMTGHKGAVLDLQWSRDSRIIFSASADMTLASWDLESGQRIRRHVGHEEIVNCVDLSKRGQDLLISGSDDGCIGIWDPRQKDAVDFFETEMPITAIALAEAGNEIYSGGIDNDIHVWDVRKRSVVYSMIGHADTVTSLQISPDSQTLLSNSHDSTVRTWDIRPFAPADRHIKTYDGAPTGLEKNLIRSSWSPNGERIAAGSGDRSVVIWDTQSAKILYKLPGHKGTVNDVRFAPNDEPIIVSGSSDRCLFLGEIGK
ncbi:WD-repeat protein 57 [Uncinocarpus reesii 1704]|uniref:WD-repeat protein 57 n=1 Tax=Uncinocarpus reesii (strain UAMH 1704) TaxID=336963 RepID=C4JKE7_UNCRE|nr:WD-repeat protein 57 [Uncinocarpus reesii 1704]EEP77255.1 WD-repeat protein 57 [Uncinocarpus reesii 1704]